METARAFRASSSMMTLLSGSGLPGLNGDLPDDRLRGLGGVLVENGDLAVPLIPPLAEKAGEHAVRHAPGGLQVLRPVAGEIVRGGGIAPTGHPALLRDAGGQHFMYRSRQLAERRVVPSGCRRSQMTAQISFLM